MNPTDEVAKLNETEHLKQLLEDKEYEKLVEELLKLPEVEVAEFLSAAEDSEMSSILSRFTPQFRAEVFSNFDRYIQTNLFEFFSTRELAQLLMHMPPDDRTDLFQRFSPEVQDKVLPYVSKNAREDIISLSSYPKRSAGGKMSTDFSSISIHMNVQQAIAKIRKDAPSKEMIYYIYVVDEEQHLLGFVSLKNLIFASPEDKIENIYKQDFEYVGVMDDQEVAVTIIEKYDLIAVPVLNADKKLVGIITHDDAMDAMRQEQTEDVEKLMGIAGEHKLRAYLKTSVWSNFKSRIIWIVILAAMEIFAGMVIQSYEYVLSNMVVLAIYIPMLASIGGNAGSQASTVVIRALTIGEIQLRDWFRVVFKEFKISLIIAVIIAVFAYGKVFFLSHGADMPMNFTLSNIAVVVSLAMSVQVVTSTVIGSILPLVASRFKLDPALIASPALATVVDITGLIIYFTTAKYYLGL
jgi:magnesium transporter